MGMIQIFRIVTALIAVVGIIFGIVIVSGNTGQAGNMLYLAYAVLIMIVFFVVLFTLKNTFTNKHTLKSTLTGLGSFLLIAIIAYIMADGSVSLDSRGNELLSGSGTKWVNTGLYLFYALALIAMISIVFTGVKSSLKK